MTTGPILATYRIETPLSLEHAAEAMAGEQSSGTFVAVPGETDDLRVRHRASVVSITPLEEVASPSLPGARGAPGAPERRYRRGAVVIAFPFDNVGTNVPTLISTVAGNLFELSQLSGVRLVDLELPRPFADAHSGPQFGIEGTRRLTGVHDRPIIGTIVKPSVGLTPEQTAELVRELAEAGIDFVKDDELMADAPHSPFDRRVQAVMRVVDEVEQRSGKRVMVAFNLSDDLDAMLRHHDTVVRAGGTCVMVSLNSVGPVGVAALRRHSALPIHGHRNGWGMLTRHPYLGLSFRPYQKLWRLIGVDQIHVNGLGNKFSESDDSVVASIRDCLTPMFGGYAVMPVVSSGQWGGQAPDTYARTGTTDLMYLAGGGIMAHPAGPKGGVTAIRQAWQAAVDGVDLEERAKEHPELRGSLETFGGRT
jgi:ribulose-bisphosphate carboxylase large chain